MADQPADARIDSLLIGALALVRLAGGEKREQSHRRRGAVGLCGVAGARARLALTELRKTFEAPTSVGVLMAR
jgi:hypothetical protein